MTKKKPHLTTPTLLPSTNSAIRNWPIIWIVLVVGLIITITATLYMKSSVEMIVNAEFTSNCNEIKNNIINRLDDHARILLSGAALFNASETVTRDEWRVFNKAQKVEKQLPGIQGIGFSLLISPAELSRHIQKIRREGFPQYKLRPDGVREIYSSIIYLEPFSGRNLRAFGYDMFSEPVRRSAMERARDTDTAALSGKVVLVQEIDKEVQAGTLMYVPVYRKSMPIETVEQRRAAIYGWVYSPYRMNDLMQGIIGNRNLNKEKQLHLQVFDGAQPSIQSLLYESQPMGDQKLRPDARFTRQIPVDFNGQRWTLRFTQTGGGFATVSYISVWLTLASGIIISLLLFSLIRTLLNTRAEAQRIAMNITELLRESEEKYRIIFNNEIYAICIFDLENLTLLDANDAYSRVYGYSRQELISGMTIHDITAEHQVSDTATRQAIREGTIFIPLRYHRKKDGTVFPVEIVGGPYVWKGRKVMFALAHDITERLRAEDAVLKGKQQYDNLVSNIPVGVYTMHSTKSGAFAFDYVSPRLAEMFNVSAESFLADPQAGFQPIHPDDLDTLVKLNQHVFQQPQPFRWEGRAIFNGEVKWLRMESTPELMENGDVLWHGVVADITDRKHMEEALRNSESRSKAMLQTIPDMMFRIDSQGIFLDYKADISDLYAQSEPTIIGKSNRDITPPEFADLVDRQVNNTLKTGTLQTFEYKLSIPNRGVRDYEARMVASGRDEVTAIVRDITDRKQAEAEKEILEVQNRQLQKSESLGRMAGAIAHHFNNQLGVVIGNLELALMEMPKGDSLRESITTAMEASNKAARMSGLMLTYLGQSFDKLEPLDLSDSCRKMLPILKVALPENVIVETDFPSPCPVINTSPDYMKQIFTNLIINAREAIGKNSGTIFLRVKTVSPAEIPTKNRFPIDWQPQDIAYACLEVTDTGSGIADKDMEKLFDPFYSTKFTGRGMGLAVVLGILKTHKGVLTVESKLERGSTFRVFFPLSEEALMQPQKAESRDDSLISTVSPVKFEEGGMVLVIEDEEPLRKMVAIMLKRLGFTVLEAKDGVEALEVFGQHQSEIKLVVSDLTMPRMNGWETLTELRKLKPSIPVILASGYDKASVMAGDHPELPQAFLGKPYRLKELGDAINQVFSQL